MMRYSEPGERLKDQSPCADIRAELKMCVLQTDCCKVQKMTPRECLKTRHESVPERCFNLVQLLYDCKHSTMDRRRRFRGPRGYN